MKAGWKNDPAMRAYFEIKRAVQQHNARCNKQRDEQFEALDEVAAELMRAAEEQAVKYNGPRH